MMFEMTSRPEMILVFIFHPFKHCVFHSLQTDVTVVADALRVFQIRLPVSRSRPNVNILG